MLANNMARLPDGLSHILLVDMPIKISLESHQFMSLYHVQYDFSRSLLSRYVNRAKEASADDSVPPRLGKDLRSDPRVRTKLSSFRDARARGSGRSA